MYSRLLYVPVSVSRNEPRYLHFFHLLSDSLLTAIFSILFVFISRFFSFSIAGRVFQFVLFSSHLIEEIQYHPHILDLLICLSSDINKSNSDHRL